MQLEIRRKRRTNRMLVAMVTIFVVCWLPLNLLHMVAEYNDAVLRWHYYLLTFLITHVIAMSSTIYNPFLYAWMNDNFKKEFQQVYHRIFTPFLLFCGIFVRRYVLIYCRVMCLLMREHIRDIYSSHCIYLSVCLSILCFRLKSFIVSYFLVFCVLFCLHGE